MKKAKVNKKLLEDPLTWLAENIGKEIKLPKKKNQPRYFIVRFDKAGYKWNNPDFIEEIPMEDIKELEISNCKWNTVEKFIKWFNGGKNE